VTLAINEGIGVDNVGPIADGMINQQTICWASVCKTVNPMLSVRCLSCLSCPVCNVRVLWPNGWTDQDETWHAGRPRPWPHCVRWGPSSPPLKGHSPPAQFSVHICCGQIAAWIKMSLGMKVGLGPGDFVLDGDPAPPSPKGGRGPNIFGPCLLQPNGWVDEAGTWHGGRPQPRRLCVRWGPSPLPPKWGQSPLPNFRPISIVAKRLHASKCHLA